MSGANKWRVILLIVVVSMMWVGIREFMEVKKVEVIFCDVKQGDGIIVKERNWELVVDVGPKNGEMVRCLGKYLPFWDKKLEVVILTHEDSDHVGGLGEVEKHYQVERLMGGGETSEQINYTDYLSSFDVIRLGKIEFEVLSPPPKASHYGGLVGDKNSNSVVGYLKVGEKIFLLMGDAEGEIEERLVWRKIVKEKVDYLKVSHHGSNNGTTKTLLEVVRPEVAIISVGKNWFGHPSEEVLKRLKEAGVKIWRTDKTGDIKIEVD
jgi:beta-lactamase superfamily II metal-dependent hydrolase